ncbi:MAG: MBL fold metallo-hydrolase [Candidatus Caldarchaeum sp.]|nr:MBL fold metallo-hydrolase [Candidatus Caldarchaeum sp.]MDW7977843.1 MBL fold metallo-hydrolase [Candidatus Caldarchaeum sp.]MDW8360074.1 MBL fold metallo-hydrolase [Candidatus Caldarchaeum sp.]
MAEIWEIKEGVEAIELDRDVEKPVRCFLLPHGDSYILVDAGYPQTAKHLLKALDKHRIQSILLTHLHIDHSGGAQAVKTAKSTTLIYHEREFQTISKLLGAKPWFTKVFKESGLQVLEKFLEYARSIPSPDEFAVDGLRFGEWRLIHTPGHTAGHMIVVGEEVGITGDLILQEDTSNVAYIPFDNYHPLTEYLKNLTRLTKMKLSLLATSHGPLLKDCRQRVAEIYAHHRQRLREVSRAVENGLETALEIAQEIKWSKGNFSQLTPFDKWLAFLETLSHLDFLVETGHLVQKPGMVYSINDESCWVRVEEELRKLSEDRFQERL